MGWNSPHNKQTQWSEMKRTTHSNVSMRTRGGYARICDRTIKKKEMPMITATGKTIKDRRLYCLTRRPITQEPTAAPTTPITGKAMLRSQSSIPLRVNCSVVDDDVKSIMKAAVAAETSGSMPSSSMRGCMTIPPPTPSMPARTPATTHAICTGSNTAAPTVIIRIGTVIGSAIDDFVPNQFFGAGTGSRITFAESHFTPPSKWVYPTCWWRSSRRCPLTVQQGWQRV